MKRRIEKTADQHLLRTALRTFVMRGLTALCLTVVFISQAYAQQAVIDVNSLPVPASGSTSLTNGDWIVIARNGITYKVLQGPGGSGGQLCGTNQWVSGLTPQGVIGCTQPAFSSISGVVSLSQLPTGIPISLGASASNTNPSRAGDLTTGVFSPIGTSVAVAAAGVEKIRVNASGLGVGTTAPGALLTVGNNTFEVNSSGAVLAGTWNGGVVGAQYGGTGAATLTAHGVVVGNGTGVVSVTGAGTTGYLLTSGGASADPTFGQLNLGTSAAITGVLGVATGGSGTGTAFTQGSVVLTGASGVYTQDNANFFWDATNHRLGIGTAAPLAVLDVNGAPRFELATLGTNTVTLGTQSPALGTTPYGWITVTCHDNSGTCRIPEFK